MELYSEYMYALVAHRTHHRETFLHECKLSLYAADGAGRASLAPDVEHEKQSRHEQDSLQHTTESMRAGGVIWHVTYDLSERHNSCAVVEHIRDLDTRASRVRADHERGEL